MPTAPLPAPTVAEPPPKEKEKEKEEAASSQKTSPRRCTRYLIVFSHQSISPDFTKYDKLVGVKNKNCFLPMSPRLVVAGCSDGRSSE